MPPRKHADRFQLTDGVVTRRLHIDEAVAVIWLSRASSEQPFEFYGAVAERQLTDVARLTYKRKRVGRHVLV